MKWADAGRQDLLSSRRILGLFAACLATALPSYTLADGGPATSAESYNFFAKCKEKMGLEVSEDFFRVQHFGRDARVANMLINLIAAGEKRGTFTSPWIFEGDPDKTPTIGGYVVITDFDGNPKLLLRTTTLRTMAFDEISERETSVDGPAVRSLDVWRQVHWAYFTRELEDLNLKPAKDMPVTIEEFEVVCEADSHTAPHGNQTNGPE